MRRMLVALAAVGLVPTAAPADVDEDLTQEGSRRRLAVPQPLREPRVTTYSIVARDPTTGLLGVAVQSHWFQVGPIVPWAEAGVGAVATQSFAELSYGPKGLALMRAGVSATDALDVLVRADAGRDVRQVAMIDDQGVVGAWTGPSCIPEAGHHVGNGFSVQANLMESATVWPAMARAYESTADKPFAERLLAALDAAEAEGGDVRGRQSAALIVVSGKKSDRPWEDRLVDLRVDDHREPLIELRRLLKLHTAYREMNAGDVAFGEKRIDEALSHYAAAARLAPDVVELPFWQAVTMYGSGEKDRALKLFRQVFATDARWAKLVGRLPSVGLLPDDDEGIEEILAQVP